jgi:transposase
MELVKTISFAHTLKVLNGNLSVVYYDVTTLYFEASDEDDLRKTGFSKDGKHQHPQIVLGLLVSENGYPLDYEIFEGNKYEGETLLPVVGHFKSKYAPKELMVIADSGLLSKKNIEQLKAQQYQYILGARIKNMDKGVTAKILDLKLQDNQCEAIELAQDDRLVVGYKEARAVRDAKNRKRGLEKLEKAVQSGKLGKKHINNRGYNKYLQIEGDVNIKINYNKFEEDAKWDGLKGYTTNTQISKEEVIVQYGQLWQIEKTFRISKSDLQIRPIYHRLRRRIEAHICISFAACKVYKELERQLKEKKSQYSVEQAIDIIKTIYRVELQTPYSNSTYSRLLIKTQEQQSIINLFGLKI